MERKDVVLGWDVGGTKSAAVAGTAGGRILDRSQWASNAPAGPDAMIADFLKRAKAMLAKHPDVRAVGVSIGGPLDTKAGIVKSPPHLPGWDNIPLAGLLEEKLQLPVVVEHDAAACLLAEWLWGAARGTTHAAYLTCGTGCGGGIMIDGRILRGPKGQSPEVGHVRLAPDGPVMFGKAGSVESFCSGEGIGKLATHMFPERFARPATTAELLKAARAGDRHARAVLAVSARRTGQLCALLADIFCPRVIVLGSLARYFGQPWLAHIRREFRREALPVNSAATRIVPAKLAERLQDLSAIAPCVFRELRNSPAS